jgi:hypothetical protein
MFWIAMSAWVICSLVAYLLTRYVLFATHGCCRVEALLVALMCAAFAPIALLVTLIGLLPWGRTLDIICDWFTQPSRW